MFWNQFGYFFWPGAGSGYNRSGYNQSGSTSLQNTIVNKLTRHRWGEGAHCRGGVGLPSALYRQGEGVLPSHHPGKSRLRMRNVLLTVHSILHNIYPCGYMNQCSNGPTNELMDGSKIIIIKYLHIRQFIEKSICRERTKLPASYSIWTVRPPLTKGHMITGNQGLI